MVLGLLVAGCQCWVHPDVNLGRRAQYYLQKNDGSYQYGFDTAEGLYQTQEGDQVNEVRGRFGADGGEVKYTAGVDGFVVTSLKKPDAASTKIYVSKTPVRYATLEELATHPEQVDDTAEVKAAKASFQAAYDAAAAAAEAAPDVNIITGAVPVATYSAPAPQAAYLAPAPVAIKYSGPSAPLDASGRVDDTAEVKAAKASFQATYDALAAAAEAAPDVNIITGAVPVATYSAPAPQAAYLAPAPVAIKYSGPSAPLDASGRVDDTAEVKAAKASFQATYDALAAAAEAAPDVNIITGAVPVATYSAPAPQAAYLAPAPVAIKYSGPSAPLDASGRVDDTAEVKAAKASFQAAYDAAAAAAEAAPDVNIITGAVPVATYSAPAPQAAYLAPAPVAIKYSGPSAPLDASGRVEDTAEVKAAKASFQATYDALAAAAEAAPDVNIITASQQAPATLPVISTYGQESYNDGSYEFSYTTSDSSRHESADAANNVKGNFEFVADDAQRRRVDYRAGAETGFIASGVHLPVSVQDTAAVAAAKASFRSAYDAAAAAADAAPDTDIITGAAPVVAVNTATYSAPAPQAAYLAPAPVAIKYSGPSAPLDASGRVEDTAEVKAAKVAFKAAYDAAAAAAEAAPDVNIITGAVPVAAVNTATYSAPAPQAAYLAPAPVQLKYDGPSAPLDASGRVEDTAEVKAAKAAFKAAYDAAAAAAAAAPDFNIITASSQAPAAAYSVASVPVSHTTYSASHGNMRTITFDGITLMLADGPSKFGYSYE